jgi:hypothetical protein
MLAFENLLNQIDTFIRKYYKNQMLKGGILFLGFALFSIILVTGIEYFGRFNSFVRATLFFSFLIVNITLLVKYIINPLMKLYSFGKRINRYQASEIIGSFFPEVSDRLLNTLQLNDSLTNSSANYELIRASVLQRSNKLSVVPFSNGIDFRKNVVYLKYVAPLVLVFVFIAMFFPSFLKQGTERVVNFDKEFKPKAPFDFVLLSNLATVEEGEDFPIELKVVGKQIPENIYLVSSQGKFLMNKKSKTSSFFVLKKLKENTAFYFEANGFSSDNFSIVVVPKAAIGRFVASVRFPSYLDKKDELISNVGDLELPEGSIVEWSVLTKNTSKVVFGFKDTMFVYQDNGFKLKKRFYNSTDFEVLLTNKLNSNIDTLKYKINIIKDAFPVISLSETKDSFSDAIRFFSGNVSDDYGLNSLIFNYFIVSESGERREFKVPVTKTFGTEMPFNYAVDFRREQLFPKDKIEYFFVVSDNDGVNGSKSTRSQLFTYELPSLSELNEKRDEKLEDSKKELTDLLNKTKDFKKNVELLKKELMNSKNTDWNKMNQLNQLKEEQKSIENSIEQLQMMMNESIQEKNQLSEMDKELLDKHELLQKLLDEVMDDELRDLLNKLEDLMKNQDKNQLQQQMEKLEMKSDDMNKQLDRSIEMLKKMQVNEKIDDIEKELRELAKDQLDLKDQIEKNQITEDNAKKKQEEINKQFEEIKEDLKELKELNESLQRPMNLGDQEEEKKQITEELEKAKDNLEKGKNKKASDNQQNSSKKMENLADQLDMLQAQANQKQNEEDIDLLRSILKSLISLSIEQEDVMLRFNKVKDSDPYYRKLGRTQRRIIDDTKPLADSLYQIAKRQPQLSSFIDRELGEIKVNQKYALEDIDEHRKRPLAQRLQYTMSSYNNLALMLNESLEKMQQEMQSAMSGSGSCDKPGGKGKKSGESSGAEGMKEMLKKQLEQMEKGKSPGGQKPGDAPGNSGDGQGMLGLGNKEIAKMAAQQSAIRQKLEQMRNELNKEGKGEGNKLNPLINELEKQERDLINKNFSNQMIKRQKEILTRLLESEKALMERGFEEKRESKSGKDYLLSNQKRIDEYNQQKLKQIELLRSVDPLYIKYYKDKANEYFNQTF